MQFCGLSMSFFRPYFVRFLGQITSLFFMSIHLNVYQAFSSPKYFQSNWVPIVFGFQQKTIWLIVFVALHVTVIQARVWFHCVHFFCPHTTIWLIVTPTQTWTFRGKIKISLHSRCFFCHIVTLSNRFEVWSKIIQRQAKSIFIAFGYDWNFGGDRNPIKFPGSGKAQIGPTAIRQIQQLLNSVCLSFWVPTPDTSSWHWDLKVQFLCKQICWKFSLRWQFC